MNILGLQYHHCDYFHDASAALYSNGKISMYEEERFNRIKHSPRCFPSKSILNLLHDLNLNINDIDVIVLPKKVDEHAIINELCSFSAINKKFAFLHCDHHLSHFLNSYYLSNFKDCAGIVIDADGDDYKSISIFDVNDGNISCTKSFSTELSLGLFYSTAAEYCSFGEFGEGKLMGLAPFGTSQNKYFLNWNDTTHDIDVLIKNNTAKKHSVLVKNNYSNSNMLKFIYELPVKNILKFLLDNFYPFKRCTYENEIIYYKDLAATILDNYNRIIVKLAEYAKSITNKDKLILSGGCIQNCVGNNIIVEANMFKNVFCSSIPHDGGISLGNVFYGIHQLKQKIIDNDFCFSNSVYSLNDIDDKVKSRIKISSISLDDIANDLANGEIIGWFLNKSELGPRALGHRSIIANPSIRENLNTINCKIKHRDMFRPLAPIILDAEFDKVFNVSSHDLCKYMLRTLTINNEYRSKLCAVCHIDNTTRPQILIEHDNKILYELISKFYNLTKIPGIINTSFNDKNVPIVESLNDAIEMLIKNDNISYIVFDGKIKIQKYKA